MRRARFHINCLPSHTHRPERRLVNLEQELVAAAKGQKIEIPLAEIRRKGLISALRERARNR